MRIIGNDPNKPRQTAATASGTLPNGRPVVINADGTVSAVGITAQSIGTGVKFETGGATYIAGAYDTTNNKVVIAYRDGDNSSYGTAIVGTVSGSSISFGSPVVFESQGIKYTDMAFDSGSSKIILGYSAASGSSGSDQGVGRVGSVSGTSISFGSSTEFGPFMDSINSQIGVAYNPNDNKAVFACRMGGSGNRGEAVVGTVSGTSISMGTPATFNSGITSDVSAGYDSGSGKVVISYRDISNSSYGTSVVATISGTSISFGSETVFTSSAVQYTQTVGDTVNGTIIIGYMDGGDSDKGKAVIGSISGTSITFGTPETFYSTAGISNLAASFDSNSSSIVFSFRGASAYGTVLAGTTTSSSFSFGTPATITTNAYSSTHSSSAFDPDTNQVIIMYADQDDGDDGIAAVYSAPSTSLTAENYIGMSQGPVQVFAEGAGSLVEYHSTDTRGNNIAYDAASGKFVAIFNPGPPTSSPPNGYAIVGTVDPSDNSITYGTAVQFESGEVYGDYMGITYDSNAEKVVITYMDTGDSNNTKAIVGTVSGTSISFGTPTTFNGQTQFLASAFDSTNNKIVVAYRDASNLDYGTAIVGTVSGTSISFGSKVVFNSGNTSNVGICFDSTNDKIIIGYRDQAFQQQATAIVGTVSGTSISFGSEVQVSPNSATDCVPIYDPVAEKVVFVYADSSDSDKGTVKVGTVSGTSISFGSAIVFDATFYDAGAGVFDANTGKVTIAYRGTSGYPYIVSGTVSDSTMTFGDPVQLGSFAAASYRFGCAYDSANFRIVSVFIDSDATPDNGESAVFNNFYEIRPSIADGGNALLDTQGGVSENQSSLTAGQSYYVQTDGTISTTAGSPSVFAGTAVSSTKLIVKG